MNTTSNLTITTTSFQTYDQFLTFLIVSICVSATSSLLYVILLLTLLDRRSTDKNSSFLVIFQLITEGQVVAIHMPIYINGLYRSISGYSQYDDSFCRHSMFAFLINVTAVQWGFFQLALNRFIAVYFPHHYKAWNTHKVTVIMALSPWLMGIVCFVYFRIGGEGGFIAIPPYGECDFAQPGPLFGLASSVSTYLPLLLSGVFYVLLFAKVIIVQRGRKIHAVVQVDQVRNRTFDRRVALAKLLFTATLAHCVCFAVMPIMESLYREEMQDQNVRQWARMVFFMGYFTTPVLFFTMNPDTRGGVMHLFRCWPARHQVIVEAQTGIKVSPGNTAISAQPVRGTDVDR